MTEPPGLRRLLALAAQLAPGILVVAELLDLTLATRLAVDAAAVGLWWLAAPRETSRSGHRALAAVLAALLLPLGYLVRAPLCLALGVAALLGALDHRRAPSEVGFGLAALATMGIAIAYLHTATLWIAEITDPLVAGLGGLLGIDGGGAYLFFAGERVHGSLLSPMPAIWIALAAAIVTHCGWRRSLVLLGISGAALVALRAGLVFLVLPAGLLPVQPWLILLLATTAAGIGTAVVGVSEARWEEPLARPVSVVVGSVLGAAVVLVATLPGQPVAEIVIDEAHGRWETTEATFTPSGYGRHTVYNYSLLRLWLEERYSVETVGERPLRPRGDLLVIKTPTLSYLPEERRAVREFVRDGGGLLVFADHTDLFGSSSIVNELLSEYGFEIEPTATIPLAGVTRRLPGRWWNGSGLVAPDSHLDLQTTATIQAQGARGLLTESLLVDLGVAVERADYSNERRFGELTMTADDDFGPAPTVAARRFGLGTVVVVADSTPWSNFSLLAPGNRELIRGVLEVFERPPVPLPAALLIALLVLVVTMFTTRRLAAEAFVWFFAAWALAWGALALVGTLGSAESVRYRSGHSLVILDEWSDVSWDTDIRLGTSVDKSVYSLFFSTMPRVGVYPEMSLASDLKPKTSLAALINVSKPLPPRRLFEIERWVRQGGTLLVMDDPLWRGSDAVLPVLSRFGFGHGIELGHGGVWEAAGPALPDNVFLLPLLLLQDRRIEKGERLVTYGEADYSLSNCEPLWVDDAGRVVLGERKVGRGRVVALLRSRVFSQLIMGDVWGGVEPGRYREELYELEYRLMDLLLAPSDGTEGVPARIDLATSP